MSLNGHLIGRKMRHVSTFALAALLVLPAVASGTDSVDVAPEVLIQESAPVDLPVAEIDAVTARGYEIETQVVEIAVPKDSDGSIAISDLSSDTAAPLRMGIDAEDSRATLVGDTIVYGADEYAVAVQGFDGGVRQSFIIVSPEAKQAYDIEYGLPPGGFLKFAALPDGQQDGSVLVCGPDGVPVAAIDKPWAKDADGRDVPTHYSIESSTTLVQVVEHSAEFAYPVTADPTTFTTYFSSGKWIWRDGVVSLSLVPSGVSRFVGTLGAGAVSAAVVIDSFNKVKSTFGGSSYWRNTPGMWDQYVCHFYFAWFKSSFNLEPSRRDVSLATTVLRLCNP